jgi:hypothetical protein
LPITECFRVYWNCKSTKNTVTHTYNKLHSPRKSGLLTCCLQCTWISKNKTILSFLDKVVREVCSQINIDFFSCLEFFHLKMERSQQPEAGNGKG